MGMSEFIHSFAGFKSYLGFLIVDLNHNHPVMKAFVMLLREEAGIDNICKPETEKDDISEVCTSEKGSD